MKSEGKMCKGFAVPWASALMLMCVVIALSSSPLAAKGGQRAWLKKAFKESNKQARTQSQERAGVARPSRNYARKPPSVRPSSDTPGAAANAPQQVITVPPVRVALLIGNQAYD